MLCGGSQNLLYLSVVLIGVESAECLGAPDGGHAVAVQDSQPDAEEDQDRSWREGYRHVGSCHGGSVDGPYQWLMKISETGTGISYETSQPYMACSSESKEGFCPNADWTCTPLNVARTCGSFHSEGGSCSGLNAYPNATISDYGSISGVSAMQKEIYQRGPIACGIDAMPLLNWESGIISDAGSSVDHVILVVGWGNLALEVLMSKKVTKVDGSVDENSGLECTVGDKSLGLLSTTIDKALGNRLKSEEAHLKSSPEYAEGAIIDLTLLQKAEKAISGQDCHRESRVRECRCRECLSPTGIDRESDG